MYVVRGIRYYSKINLFFFIQHAYLLENKVELLSSTSKGDKDLELIIPHMP